MVRISTKLSAALVLVALGGAAYADIPAVQLECFTDGGYYAEWNPQGQVGGQGTYTYQGGYSDPFGVWSLTWDLVVKSDPYINAVYGLTNTTGVTQNFTLIVTLPVSPAIGPTSLIGGSTGGSINDANFSGGATLATFAPFSFYEGQIDGVGALSIYGHPYSVTAVGGGATAPIPTLNPGLPGPTLPGGPVNSTIGIVHHFSLSPGDTVAITSFFVVTPEPTSVLLIGIGALLLRRR